MLQFTPAQALGVSKWWSPVITFTGVQQNSKRKAIAAARG
jgi:hypothetical protein